MADELIFYTNPQSRGRIVRWMLEEVGMPYRSEILEYGTGMKTESYRDINPMGKVPSIVHNGRVVTEAAAICAYLADAFPDARLAPPAAARDRYYRWLFFFASAVEAAAINRSLGFEVPSDRERMVGYGNYATVLDTVEIAVGTAPYIAGEAFSAADVYCGSQLGWGMEFGTIEPRPAFEAYWRRISDRPARLRANAIDDALVPTQT